MQTKGIRFPPNFNYLGISLDSWTPGTLESFFLINSFGDDPNLLRIFLAKQKIVLYVRRRNGSPVINQGNKNLAWSVITKITFPVLMYNGYVTPVSMT